MSRTRESNKNTDYKAILTKYDCQKAARAASKGRQKELGLPGEQEAARLEFEGRKKLARQKTKSGAAYAVYRSPQHPYILSPSGSDFEPNSNEDDSDGDSDDEDIELEDEEFDTALELKRKSKNTKEKKEKKKGDAKRDKIRMQREAIAVMEADDSMDVPTEPPAKKKRSKSDRRNRAPSTASVSSRTSSLINTSNVDTDGVTDGSGEEDQGVAVKEGGLVGDDEDDDEVERPMQAADRPLKAEDITKIEPVENALKPFRKASRSNRARTIIIDHVGARPPWSELEDPVLETETVYHVHQKYDLFILIKALARNHVLAIAWKNRFASAAVKALDAEFKLRGLETKQDRRNWVLLLLDKGDPYDRDSKKVFFIWKGIDALDWNGEDPAPKVRWVILQSTYPQDVRRASGTRCGWNSELQRRITCPSIVTTGRGADDGDPSGPSCTRHPKDTAWWKELYAAAKQYIGRKDSHSKVRRGFASEPPSGPHIEEESDDEVIVDVKYDVPAARMSAEDGT
ncbi:hypothetical protein NMY22_g1230 [Coprinellus aureogranulatus]|nr:hypothetical protein NMY22_g1230 [Coprinellus aureogranulatus]